MTDETPTDPWQMTPEQATARLEQMSAAYRRGPEPSANPQTPAEAQAKLDALKQDKQWADQLMAGGLEARHEFQSLTELSAQADVRLDSVLNGTATTGRAELTTAEHPFTTTQLQSAVDGFRESGVSDDIVRMALDGSGTLSREEHSAFKELQRKREGDAEWRRRLLTGDHEAARELTLLSIALTLPVVDK